MAQSHSHHPKIRRRTAIQAGAVGILGLGMNHLHPLRSVQAAGPDVATDNRGKAKSCIFIFLSGGLAQQDKSRT